MNSGTGILGVLLISALAGFAELSRSYIPGQLDVNHSTSYYAVDGSSAETLLVSLNQNGPEDLTGKKRYALTRWHLDWEWPKNPDGSPQIGAIKLQAEIETLLPRWESRESAEPALNARWHSFLLQIREHESKHTKICENHFAKIQAEVMREALRNPNLTEESANHLIKGMLKELERANIEYDRRTENGQLDGGLKLVS